MFFGVYSASASQLPAPKGTVRVIAHRGASGYAPENTMASFKKALELKAEMIELDVHLTKDGVAVIMHDGKTDRTTGVKGEIKEMTYEEIQKLDAGSWYSKDFAGEKVPTLQEVLEWASGKIQVNIEIKAPGCEKIVVDLINKYDMKNTVIVTSFDHTILKKIKDLDPEVITGALVGDVSNEQQIKSIINLCKPDAINPNYLYLNKTKVKYSHDLGLFVNPYTVNDVISMKQQIKYGVEGIITNYPDVLLATLDKMKKPEEKKEEKNN